MTETGNRLDSQSIPESPEEGHLPERFSPGPDEDIGLDAFEDLEQGWDFQGVVLTIGIHCHYDLIAFLKDVSEPCSERCPLSEISRMFQNPGTIFPAHSLRLVAGTIIYNDRVDMKGTNLLENISQGTLSIIGRDEDTDAIQEKPPSSES
jgi:hypothetical protein